jgi:hypothetical protein
LKKLLATSEPSGLETTELPEPSTSQPSCSSTATQTTLSSSSPRNQKLRQQLDKVKKASKRLLKQTGNIYNEENEELQTLKKLSGKYLKEPLGKLIEMQVLLLGKEKQGRRYNSFTKQFALTVHFYGPKVYKFLGTLITLPSDTTLRLYTQKWTISCGFDELALRTISLKLNHLNNKERECALIIDEMNIKPNYFYNISKDGIVGVHNLGHFRQFKPAKYAMGLMLREITVNWKQPLGYFFLQSNCPVDDLKMLIFKYIDYLKQIDCVVKVVITDLGVNYIKFAKEVGVQNDQTYFYVNRLKILYLFDPCLY